jgi:hypothetical protein
VSLSQEPALSALKDYFVCGYRDITTQPYCGMSGRHEVSGKAVRTTNGAGPHNIQMFVLNPDGTVLTCLPGYWNSQDLVTELKFAYQLNQVYTNASLSKPQKDATFRQMQLAHIAKHTPGMVGRSHLQGFDAQYEAKNRLATTDTIRNRGAVQAALSANAMVPMDAFKTTDELMHERMAKRPFVAYDSFDVASYVDYGLQKYDKHEDARDSYGKVIEQLKESEPTLGHKHENSSD